MLEALLREQSSSGAFRSFVHTRGAAVEDWNGFTTALVLRALARVTTGPLAAARERALDFLESCESPAKPYAFGFWPRSLRPKWVGDLPEDCDDTAVCALELRRAGRRGSDFAKRVACLALVRHRLQSLDPPSPPWLRPGVFLTWLRAGHHSSIVDCCANANVAAFLASEGLQHLPGYAEACAMIEDALAWAGDSLARARAIVPFYPNPRELFYAVEHAFGAGASELGPTLAVLRGRAWNRDPDDSREPVICGNANGSVCWTSPAVRMARKFASSEGACCPC